MHSFTSSLIPGTPLAYRSRPDFTILTILGDRIHHEVLSYVTSYTAHLFLLRYKYTALNNVRTFQNTSVWEQNYQIVMT
jgi:hypothetical protein